LDLTNYIGTTLVTTVDCIKKYSVRHYSNAKNAFILQNTIGRPSAEELIKYVKGNMIPKCNLRRQDIICAEDIFSPNLGFLEVKMTRWPTEHVCKKSENTYGNN